MKYSTKEVESFLATEEGKKLLNAIKEAKSSDNCEISFLLGLQSSSYFMPKIRHEDPENIVFMLLIMSVYLWENTESDNNET